MYTFIAGGQGFLFTLKAKSNVPLSNERVHLEWNAKCFCDVQPFLKNCYAFIWKGLHIRMTCNPHTQKYERR